MASGYDVTNANGFYAGTAINTAIELFVADTPGRNYIVEMFTLYIAGGTFAGFVVPEKRVGASTTIYQRSLNIGVANAYQIRGPWHLIGDDTDPQKLTVRTIVGQTYTNYFFNVFAAEV